MGPSAFDVPTFGPVSGLSGPLDRVTLSVGWATIEAATVRGSQVVAEIFLRSKVEHRKRGIER